MCGEYPIDCRFIANTHVGTEYALYRPVEVTVCGEMGDDGQIIDYEPNHWYSITLPRYQIVTTLELSDVSDTLVHVHGENVVAWISVGARVLSSVDDF